MKSAFHHITDPLGLMTRAEILHHEVNAWRTAVERLHQAIDYAVTAQTDSSAARNSLIARNDAISCIRAYRKLILAVQFAQVHTADVFPHKENS